MRKYILVLNDDETLLTVEALSNFIITPVSKWGPSIPENLQTLCWKCNRAKSNS